MERDCVELRRFRDLEGSREERCGGHNMVGR
jgi:hypothetical protein